LVLAEQQTETAVCRLMLPHTLLHLVAVGERLVQPKSVIKVARAAVAVPLERQKPVVLAIRQAPPRLKATMAVAQIHRAATMVAQAVVALVPLVEIHLP
jgi:hypothetical protein